MAVSFPQSLPPETQAAVTQGYKNAATPPVIQTLRYPYKKLTDSDDYLVIKVVKYKAPGISSGADNFSFKTSTQSLQNNIKTPEAIILFGGLTKAGDLILKPAREHMEANVIEIFENKVKILFSHLKESDAAILGASALMWE